MMLPKKRNKKGKILFFIIFLTLFVLIGLIQKNQCFLIVCENLYLFKIYWLSVANLVKNIVGLAEYLSDSTTLILVVLFNLIIFFIHLGISYLITKFLLMLIDEEETNNPSKKEQDEEGLFVYKKKLKK